MELSNCRLAGVFLSMLAATAAGAQTGEPVPVMVYPPSTTPPKLPPKNAVAAGVRVVEWGSKPFAGAEQAYAAFRDRCTWLRSPSGSITNVSGLVEIEDWRSACVAVLTAPARSPSEAARFFRAHFGLVEIAGGAVSIRLWDYPCPRPSDGLRLRGSMTYVPLAAPVLISGSGDARIDRLWTVENESAGGDRGPSGHFELEPNDAVDACPSAKRRPVSARARILLPTSAIARLRTR